ncbi:GlxA family transcriptional regulator [Iodobacter ciconiae]|uniref:GlxA family transcriptional regulator n=1 Tax=Iodobacter ciconiae TaxID=2496266 RepID=A0A3S8ZPL3_9NEIS|nr:GlxA family transcriptional regulator [Iodobacter ciconiae]AZN35403.1 GlxA family transcriptional regulator [Iodobacter ciconiae]
MRSVAIAIFPDVQALDVAGPVDVFAEANQFVAQSECYEIRLIGSTEAPIRASNGMQLVADLTYADAVRSFDIALIAGGPKLPVAPPRKNLIDWVIKTIPLCKRYGSICTGAFVLGQAGLLNGKRVTTHWQNAPQLAQQFPEAQVDLDSIYIRDDNLLTSAGVTAGIDAALAIVAEDHGAGIALTVAKRLLVFAQRRGGQSQFSPYLIAPIDEHSPMAKVQQFVMNHFQQQFSVDRLAAIAGMSSRNFARLFVQLNQITPHQFIDQIRIDNARRLLESSNLPLKTIAFECGFMTAERMRIVFSKRLGVTPNTYRMSFNAL